MYIPVFREKKREFIVVTCTNKVELFNDRFLFHFRMLPEFIIREKTKFM